VSFKHCTRLSFKNNKSTNYTNIGIILEILVIPRGYVARIMGNE
jgi:hypothetical protein